MKRRRKRTKRRRTRTIPTHGWLPPFTRPSKGCSLNLLCSNFCRTYWHSPALNSWSKSAFQQNPLMKGRILLFGCGQLVFTIFFIMVLNYFIAFHHIPKKREINMMTITMNWTLSLNYCQRSSVYCFTLSPSSSIINWDSVYSQTQKQDAE